MFNVGFLEIAVIAVMGLLFFGPEKLPKAIHTLVLGIRSLKSMANEASSSLQGAAGIDTSAAKQTMTDLADLHPKRWAAGLLTDEPNKSAPSTSSATSAAQVSEDATATANVADSAKDGGADSGTKRVEHPSTNAELDRDLP